MLNPFLDSILTNIINIIVHEDDENLLIKFQKT